MEILGLAIQKFEDATIKDHHLVAARLAHIMQEKECEIDHLHEQIAKLQQQLEVTADNKVNTFDIFFQSPASCCCLNKKKNPLSPHQLLLLLHYLLLLP